MTAAPFAAEAGNAEDGEELTGLLGGTAPVRRGGGGAWEAQEDDVGGAASGGGRGAGAGGR